MQSEHVTLMGRNATKYQNIKASRDILLLYKQDIIYITDERMQRCSSSLLAASFLLHCSDYDTAACRARFISITPQTHSHMTEFTMFFIKQGDGGGRLVILLR